MELRDGRRRLLLTAIVDGVVYVGSYDGKVYALDAETGELVWSYDTDDSVFSSPAAVDGVVYIGSDDGHVCALDAKQVLCLERRNRGADLELRDGTLDPFLAYGGQWRRLFRLL